MALIKWTSEPSESRVLKIVLAPGGQYDVPDQLADIWVSAGSAEFVRAKPRRVAAPESAVKE